MWASTMTRPDIADAVRTVAKFCDNHGPVHWKGVSKVLQYLFRTHDQGPECSVTRRGTVNYSDSPDGLGRALPRTSSKSEGPGFESRPCAFFLSILQCGKHLVWVSKIQNSMNIEERKVG